MYGERALHVKSVYECINFMKYKEVFEYKDNIYK